LLYSWIPRDIVDDRVKYAIVFQVCIVYGHIIRVICV
jgi:hypothetical protein